MAKLTLSDIVNLQNEGSTVVTMNNNSALTETALENTLSRDGTSPNQMSASLDMNSNRILNLPNAISAGEPVSLGQLNSSVVRFDIAQSLTTDQQIQARTNIGTGSGGGGGGGGSVASVFGRSGAVVSGIGDYTVAQVTGAAPLVSPTFTGIPAAPTAAPGTNTTQLATTAYVIANLPSAVTSFNGRSGAVTSVAGDYTAAQITNTAAGGIAAITVQNALNELDTEKANIASPTFTGVPAAPTAAAATNTTQIATTAFVDTSFVKTPATNTADKVPQWNGANSKTLKDGLTVGTGASNLVQLDGSSKLPAVDGSALINLPGSAALHGQCYLSKSGANLLLKPKNGNKIIINSSQQSIPDAGVTLAAPSQAVTVTIASPAVFTWTAHGMVAGAPVIFTTTGALPTGLVTGVVYYVIAAGLTANAFEVALAPGGAAINTSGTQSGTHKIGTLQWIYVWMSGGTMTLEFSTTTHATQATTNVEIKSGDATRTLVGMAFDQAGAWEDIASRRHVLSWFNRCDKHGRTGGGGGSTTSLTSIEINAAARWHYLTWSDEASMIGVSGFMSNFNGGNSVYLDMMTDGVLEAVEVLGTSPFSTYAFPSANLCWRTGTEGYHYSNYSGRVDGNTGFFNSMPVHGMTRG